MKKAADTPAPGVSEVLLEGEGVGAEGGSVGDAESRGESKSHSEPLEDPGCGGAGPGRVPRQPRRGADGSREDAGVLD